MKVTVSVIKADIGGFPGHGRVHDSLKAIARRKLEESGEIIDFRVASCGDDLVLIIIHDKGVDAPEIHSLAWEVFKEGSDRAKELKLYGAGQDLLKEAFSNNVRGMGPGVAEMEFEERKSEPFVVFLADKTEPSAFNLPLFKIFADPFNTAGLVIEKHMHRGFRFEVWDVYDRKKVFLETPEEIYDLLALIGGRRYVIKRVFDKDGNIAAVVSTEKLNLIAGKYVGKDDPVAIVRAQSSFPSVGEILEPFATPWLVAGWMRGSHNAPLMPVGEKDATPTRFDGPPRIVALGFQISNGKITAEADLFEDKAFDRVRAKALEIADYLRLHGPFEPHRLPEKEMEYTTLSEVLEKLKDRFVEIEE